MKNLFSRDAVAPLEFSSLPERARKTWENMLNAFAKEVKLAQAYWYGIGRYVGDFNAPSFKAAVFFLETEKENWVEIPLRQHVDDYVSLLEFNRRIAEKGAYSGLSFMNHYHMILFQRFFSTLSQTISNPDDESHPDFLAHEAALMEKVAYGYPDAIRKIKSEFGFHFTDERYVLAAETDRFFLYQVLPWKKDTEVRKKGKPIVIIPPAVLGANILAFLPDENKSYVHAFANHGIPTYIRIVKNIQEHPAVQMMTGEDDARDTRYFCEKLKGEHGRNVTINGYCQGGFLALLNMLSGKLDGLADALISSVAPMDGSRSK